MVIDTSALVAIALKEPSRAALLDVIQNAVSRGEPVLAAGNDFRATDIAVLRF